MNKKYWYFTEDTDAIQALPPGVFCVWGAVPGLASVTQPTSFKHLICVDWAGRSLQERTDFEALPGVTPLPHKDSRQPVDVKTMLMLKGLTKGGAHAVNDADHTHDIVEKLSGHTEWGGWRPHL
jgi:hypothetical protein